MHLSSPLTHEMRHGSLLSCRPRIQVLGGQLQRTHKLHLAKPRGAPAWPFWSLHFAKSAALV